MKKRLLYLTFTIAGLCFIGCNEKEDVFTEEKRGSIYGFVTDFQDGKPVANANVSLRPGGESTLTGIDGRYEFKDVKDGDYYIKVSKAEYSDLVDDSVIHVRNGQHMRRDVQIQKLPTNILVTDMNGTELHVLDFGSAASIVSKSFKIFNNGTVSVHCVIEYSCAWIASVSSIPETIIPGQTVPVTVTINRELLPLGENTTIMSVRTDNGSAEITITATSTSGNPPDVNISPASNITATTALCEGRIVNTNGGNITNCGFCYSTTTAPTINDRIVSLGPSTGNFSSTLLNLEHNTTYHVRAFATSSLGTGYSSEITFATMSCIPICGATTVENMDPTAVMGYSTVTNDNGCDIISKGLCWSISHTPTINDQMVSSGFGEGAISGMLYPLQPSTTYKVRSYATNVYGTTYGPESTFTTISGIPTVTTTAASIIEYYYDDYILTGGNVTDNAGTVVWTTGVCYGFSPNPDLSTSFQHTEDGFGDGPFTSYIPLPSTSGYLYIRAYATTQYGTGYGNQVSIYIP